MVESRLRIMLSGGCFQLMAALCGRVGGTVEFVRGASVGNAEHALPRRLAAGETADIIVFAEDALSSIRPFLADVESRRLLATSSIGIGTALPHITAAPQTLEGLVALLEQVERFGFSSSVSGQFLTQKLAELGVPAALLAKGRQSLDGPVGTMLVRGEADIGFQQISELIEIAGVTVLGAVPEVLQKRTRYEICALAGARDVAAADRFIDSIIAARTPELLRERGLEYRTEKWNPVFGESDAKPKT